jgi:hypothetical protein
MATNYDLNGDGKITDAEIDKSAKLIDLDMRERKSDAQRKMAWTSMLSMIVVTGFIFSPIITNERMAVLGDVIPLFYIAQAGIIGAYFGASAWMHSK